MLKHGIKTPSVRNTGQAVLVAELEQLAVRLLQEQFHFFPIVDVRKHAERAFEPPRIVKNRFGRY